MARRVFAPIAEEDPRHALTSISLKPALEAPSRTIPAARAMRRRAGCLARGGIGRCRTEARAACGRRESRYFGATDLPNFFRKPYGPGWALAGDAGCHKDPYLALGICDAFRDVEWLADAIDTGLSGRGDLLGALEGYEKRRNDASRQEYWQNLNAARFVPPPA